MSSIDGYSLNIREFSSQTTLFTPAQYASLPELNQSTIDLVKALADRTLEGMDDMTLEQVPTKVRLVEKFDDLTNRESRSSRYALNLWLSNTFSCLAYSGIVASAVKQSDPRYLGIIPLVFGVKLAMNSMRPLDENTSLIAIDLTRDEVRRNEINFVKFFRHPEVNRISQMDISEQAQRELRECITFCSTLPLR